MVRAQSQQRVARASGAAINKSQLIDNLHALAALTALVVATAAAVPLFPPYYRLLLPSFFLAALLQHLAAPVAV